MQSNEPAPTTTRATGPFGRTDPQPPADAALVVEAGGDEALVLIVGRPQSTANVVRLALVGEQIRAAIVPPDRLRDEIDVQEPALVVLCRQTTDPTVLDDVAALHRLGTPALVVGPRPTSRTLCAALDGGAEDWISWPFHPDELAARCRAILRRRQSRPTRRLVAGDVEIDLDARVARTRSTPLALTPSDWDVLERLGRRPGTVVPHSELGAAERSAASKGALARARVARLRRRLDAAGARNLIRLVHSEGYRLDLD